MYKGDVEAGETIPTVLIFEIPREAAANVSDIVLSITVDGATSSMQLQGGSEVKWTETAEEIETVEEIESLEETETELDETIDTEESSISENSL